MICRSVSNMEILCYYSIPFNCLITNIGSPSFTTWLDDHLPFSFWWKLHSHLVSHVITSLDIELDYIFGARKYVDTVSYYTFTKRNDILNWDKAYLQDTCTDHMIKNFTDTLEKAWTDDTLSSATKASHPL